MNHIINVIKRNESIEKIDFNKIVKRLETLANLDPPLHDINILDIAQILISQMKDLMKTSELDILASTIAMSKSINHPEYGVLASRICISNLHKETSNNFTDNIELLYNNKNLNNQKHSLINDNLYKIVQDNKDFFNDLIIHNNDYLFDYFGFKTLEKSYLLKIYIGNGVYKIVERPQYLLLRVSIGIHNDDLEAIKETYLCMSNHFFIHATPTLFNAGTPIQNFSSCYLLGTSDSVSGMYKTVGDCAAISKVAGGIGVHFSNIRAKNALIRGTNGTSDGIVPLLKVYNEVSRHINQCFTPGTLIYTNKGIKKIEDINYNDILYTFDIDHQYQNELTVNKINKIVSNYVSEDLITFKTDYSRAARSCTSSHEIYCIDINDTQIVKTSNIKSFKNNKYKKSNFNDVNYKNLNQTIKINPTFIEAEKLTTSHFTCLPIKLLDAYVLNNLETTYNKNILMFYGLLINLHFTNNQALILETDKITIDLNYVINSKHIKPLLLKIFNAYSLNYTLYKSNDDDTNNDIFIIDYTELNKCNISLKSFGIKKPKSYNPFNLLYNYLNPDMSINIFKNHSFFNSKDILYFIFGFIMNIDLNKDDVIILKNDDKLLTLLQFLFFELGINIKSQKLLEKTALTIPKYNFLYSILELTNKPFYNIDLTDYYYLYFDRIYTNYIDFQSFPSNIKLNDLKTINEFIYDDYLFTRITSIEKTPYSGYVYDFNMFNNHNYITDIGLVHNSGKRNGSFACYLEPWHADIFEFLDLKLNTGEENKRARDLFYALWIPDAFMKAVKNNGDWYLMCPDKCPGLQDVYGEEYDKLYQSYIDQNLYTKKIKATELWNKILKSQIETGTPYMLYKDACNLKSNQKNLGTIKSSNLCSEIIEYSDDKEYAICNLCSISLKAFVDIENKTMNWEKLKEITRIITINMNKIIDNNFYPTPETKYSNFKNRPIGIGVQGLANVFMLLKLPYTSQEAKDLNKKIFETIYLSAVNTSIELAKKHGFYESYPGSPTSAGILQYDLWNIDENTLFWKDEWKLTKQNLKKYGIYNSLLTTCMPTASTSQILGNIESFEAITSNLYIRNTLAGTFPLINKYLVNDLLKLNLWGDGLLQDIIRNDGSIQEINNIPQNIKDLYKIVWEIKQKDIIDMSIQRAPFIDQSQSLNIFLAQPSLAKLSGVHLYGWAGGLKTGMYYLRSKPSSTAAKISIGSSKEKIIEKEPTDLDKLVCSLENKEDCLMCSG